MKLQLGFSPKLPAQDDQADSGDSILDVLADEIISVAGQEDAGRRVREILAAWKKVDGG